MVLDTTPKEVVSGMVLGNPSIVLSCILLVVVSVDGVVDEKVFSTGVWLVRNFSVLGRPVEVLSCVVLGVLSVDVAAVGSE